MGPDMPDPAELARSSRAAAPPAEGAALVPRDEAGAPLASLGRPQNLVATRKKGACDPKIDTARYQAVRRIEDLERWIAEARDLGVVAVHTETTAVDDGAAGELCGIALAIEPGRACYVAADAPQGRRRHVRRRVGGGPDSAR